MTRTRSDVRLSVVLGDATRELHRSAERTRAMGALLRGTLSRESYAVLLRNLHAVYERLEAGLQRHASSGEPVLDWLGEGELLRAPAMVQDLTHIHGGSWQTEIPRLPATEAYVATLDDLAATWPPGLAAHAWVRYMGDLSGGQVLGRLVARNYDLDAPDGVRTYDFPGEVEEHKATFRRHLDEISTEHHDRMVAEARRGFAHSIEMLEEVAERD